MIPVMGGIQEVDFLNTLMELMIEFSGSFDEIIFDESLIIQTQYNL